MAFHTPPSAAHGLQGQGIVHVDNFEADPLIDGYAGAGGDDDLDQPLLGAAARRSSVVGDRPDLRIDVARSRSPSPVRPATPPIAPREDAVVRQIKDTLEQGALYLISQVQQARPMDEPLQSKLLQFVDPDIASDPQLNQVYSSVLASMATAVQGQPVLPAVYASPQAAYMAQLLDLYDAEVQALAGKGLPFRLPHCMQNTAALRQRLHNYPVDNVSRRADQGRLSLFNNPLDLLPLRAYLQHGAPFSGGYEHTAEFQATNLAPIPLSLAPPASPAKSSWCNGWRIAGAATTLLSAGTGALTYLTQFQNYVIPYVNPVVSGFVDSRSFFSQPDWDSQQPGVAGPLLNLRDAGYQNLAIWSGAAVAGLVLASHCLRTRSAVPVAPVPAPQVYQPQMPSHSRSLFRICGIIALLLAADSFDSRAFVARQAAAAAASVSPQPSPRGLPNDERKGPGFSSPSLVPLPPRSASSSSSSSAVSTPHGTPPPPPPPLFGQPGVVDFSNIQGSAVPMPGAVQLAALHEEGPAYDAPRADRLHQ